VPFDFSDDVLLQNFPLEAAERVLQRLAFLEIHLSHKAPPALTMIWDTTIQYGPCGACRQHATIPVQMAWQHIADVDLERYHLGMVKDEAELAPLEEHLLACEACAERAEEAAAYVDALRAAMIEGEFDLE
jgi:hypothetical protein